MRYTIDELKQMRESEDHVEFKKGEHGNVSYDGGNPTDCSPPGSSVHEIFQARVLEWGATAFSKSSLDYL